MFNPDYIGATVSREHFEMLDFGQRDEIESANDASAYRTMADIINA